MNDESDEFEIRVETRLTPEAEARMRELEQRYRETEQAMSAKISVAAPVPGDVARGVKMHPLAELLGGGASEWLFLWRAERQTVVAMHGPSGAWTEILGVLWHDMSSDRSDYASLRALADGMFAAVEDGGGRFSVEMQAKHVDGETMYSAKPVRH
jgi:hypothetical protein